MYSAIELKALSIKPRINDISLKVLSEYYEMFLYPFIYHYHRKSIDEEKDIELRFEKENFCHLLGIESIVKYSVPMRNLHNYKGENGWDNAIIHLGIEKHEKGYYFPRTFFVEKVSKKEDDIYIAKQEEINVLVKDRVIMQGMG